MHDFTLNQAAGLQGLPCKTGAQLIAMISHGDDLAELPLLWQMCSVLVELGYPVTVLDGTSTETNSNSGLAQLLQHAFRHNHSDKSTLNWTVLPAAQGFADLCESSARLQRLGALFDSEDLVIAYGDAQTLATLLANTSCMPVLSISDNKNSLLTSYLALKRLLVTGRLTPLMVNLVQETRESIDSHSSIKLKNLMACANNFLGFDTRVFQVVASADNIPDAADVRKLTMGLLDSAITLTPSTSMPFNAGNMEPQARFIRNY
jgi:hypothetical protein